MQLELQARHFELTDTVRDYVERKVERLDQKLPGLKATRVDLDHGMRRSLGEVYTAQVTTWVDGSILRAEEMHSDLYAAIDLATEKMHRQIGRYRGKRLHRWHDHTKPVVGEPSPAEEAEPPRVIVRRKRFPMVPMTEDEAVEQIDLLGHDFFVFVNAESGMVNVMYHREDGQLGLIEPELA